MGSNVNAEINVKIIKAPRGIKNAFPDLTQIKEDLENTVQHEIFVIRGNYNLVAEQECRWNTITEDMKKLSALYPGMLFTVNSSVPDYDDETTREYFYDGKTHKAVIQYSEFDEELLK